MIPKDIKQLFEESEKGILQEGLVRIRVPREVKEKISRKLEAFYNPLSAIGRDIMVELVSTFGVKQGADLLAATGIRGLRLLVEANLEEMHFNDYNPKAIKYLLDNISLNEDLLKRKRISFSNLDARQLIDLRVEYLELDPYGSANPFLILIETIRNRGYLGVTFTDTGPLTGSKWRKARIKYFTDIRKTSFYLEVGLRVLIKHIILKGAELEFAMFPFYGHYNYHYYRAYFRKEKGSSKIEKLIDNIGYINYCPHCDYREISERPEKKQCPVCGKYMLSIGPLYLGRIWEFELKPREYFLKESKKTIERINSEQKIDTPWYYDLHSLASKLGMNVPSLSKVKEKLEELGYRVERTHFTDKGIRTNADYKDIVSVMKDLNKS